MRTKTKLYGITNKQYRKLKADHALNQIALLSERISRLEDILFKKTYEAYHKDGEHYFIEYKEDNR